MRQLIVEFAFFIIFCCKENTVNRQTLIQNRQPSEHTPSPQFKTLT